MKLNLKQKLELKKLKDLNASSIEVTYYGGGDDGDIDSINIFNKKNESIKFNDNLVKNLADYFYGYLCEQIEWDWINNDGGNGVMKFDLINESISIDHVQTVREDYEYYPENKDIFDILNVTS